MLRRRAWSCLLSPQRGSYCGTEQEHPLVPFKIKVGVAVIAKAHGTTKHCLLVHLRNKELCGIHIDHIWLLDRQYCMKN